jgi:hypothetical protein
VGIPPEGGAKDDQVDLEAAYTPETGVDIEKV